MQHRFSSLTLSLALAVTLGCAGCAPEANSGAGSGSSATECGVLPDGFTTIETAAPNVQVDLRYAGTQNFTGSVVDGYADANAVVLRSDAAEALASVQLVLEQQGLGLLVYDGFRPTRAVDNFVEWAANDDERTKAEFYPNLEKTELFPLGYIAEKSGHSLGGTVDLTIIDRNTGEPLDMGGEFDLFDERSHYSFTDLTPTQVVNRQLLHDQMILAGFAPYAEEWWHFSYPVPEDATREDFPLALC